MILDRFLVDHGSAGLRVTAMLEHLGGNFGWLEGPCWLQVGSSWLQVGPSWLKLAPTWSKLTPWNQIEAILLKEVIPTSILQTSGLHFLMIFHDFSCPEPSIFDERLERNAYF